MSSDKMRIVEDSYYDHDEHGRVKVVDVTNGVVSMEKQQDDIVVGGARIPGATKQSAAGFQRDAEPADVTVDADMIVVNSDAIQS
jgi:hypothetical protein